MKFWFLFALSVVALAAAEGTKPCVFCEIVAGKRPAVVVYRDKVVMAFMDHAPANPGHMLVIPVAHADNFLDAPPETVAAMARLAQRLGSALRQSGLKAEGVRVTTNTGEAAGQSVFHAHLHVIPRFAGDDSERAEKNIVPREQLEIVAARIRGALGEPGTAVAARTDAGASTPTTPVSASDTPAASAGGPPAAPAGEVSEAPATRTAGATGKSESTVRRLLRLLRPNYIRDFVREYEPTEIGLTWDEGDERFMDFKFSAMFPLLALNHDPYPLVPPIDPNTGDTVVREPLRIRDLNYGQSTLFMSGTIRAGQYIETRPSSPVVGKRFNPQVFVRWWALDDKGIAASERKYFDLIFFGHESNGQSIMTDEQFHEQWEIYRKLEKDPTSEAARENARLGARDAISRGWDYLGAEWGWSWGEDPVRGRENRHTSRQLRVKARHFLPVGIAQGTAENYHDWEGDGPRFRRRHYDGLMLQYAATGNPFLRWTRFFTGRYSVTYTTGLSQPFQHSTVEVEAGAKIGALPLAAWYRYGYNGDLVDYYRHGASYGVRIAIWEY